MVVTNGGGGFEAPRRVYELDFDDTELHGLKVTARGASLGQFLSLGQLAEDAGQAEGAAAEMQAITALLGVFDKVLVDWNLTRDGEPVPATAAGMATLDPAHAMLVIGAWQRAVAAVPAPLPAASISGSPSLAGSMPMEPLSPSLAS